jgi:hypothetical protein
MSKFLSIVVPYRNRQEHLAVFAPHMEKFLYDLGIENFKILIVEQDDPLVRSSIQQSKTFECWI